jgi:hypothetical protein
MRVSFNQSTSPNIKNTNGYGYAGNMCKKSLEALGHEVNWRDSTADIEMNFIQPEKWHWSGPYRIGYVPWESTGFPEGWIERFNNDCDELWTPSPVIAQWMMDAGVTKPVKVYQHGVESLWSPKKRSLSGRFQVFHHGGEALRKGANLAMAAQQRVLWEEYACINFKRSVARFNVSGSHRMNFIPGNLPIDELVALYHRMNLMVYPSWGEGFGLTPLQAMATGMPVLITRGWAPYEYLLEDYQLIDSELVQTSMNDFPEFNGFVTDEHLQSTMHPGKMFKPDFDDLCDKLRYQYENRHELAEKAFELAPVVHSDYDWVALTESAFSHLV